MCSNKQNSLKPTAEGGQVVLTKAETIVWFLTHAGNIKSWKERLPNRPDWQRDIDFVEQILANPEAKGSKKK